MTALDLGGQSWEFDDGTFLDTREVFARLIADEIERERLCRNNQDPGWKPIDLRFQLIGRYGVLRELGDGAFGKVYLAFDAARRDGKTGRLVAIKRPNEKLLDKYARAAGRKTETRLSETENQLAARSWAKLQIGQAFSKEAILTARLAMCENVVSVVDHDVTVPYLALEFCNGGELSARLQKPYDLAQAIRWGREIAAALEAAHGLKPDALIHRDLKPDNILLDGETIKVSDFGTSQMMQSTESLRSLKGGYTPSYAAPEAFDEKAYPATDVWSLGVILYQLISGKRPFQAGNMVQLARKIEREEAPPLDKMPGLKASPCLIALVNACLRKDPSARPSAAQCRQHLEALAGGGAPPAARPAKPAPRPRSRAAKAAPRSRSARTAPPPARAPEAPPSEEAPSPSRSRLPVILGASVLGVAALALALMQLGGSAEPTPPKEKLPALSLLLATPSEGAAVSASPVTVTGTTAVGASVTVNGVAATVDAAGAFKAAVPVRDGPQVLAVRAVLARYESALIERSIQVALPEVALTLTAPADGAWVRASTTITGRASGAGRIAELLVNGQSVALNEDGFRADIALARDPAEILVEAKDAEGQILDRAQITVRVDGEAPRLVDLPGLEGDRVTLGEDRVLRGRIADQSLKTLSINGAALAFNDSGAFQLTIEDEGPVRLIAVDAVGQRLERALELAFQKPPPSVDPKALLAELETWSGASEAEQDAAIALATRALGAAYAFVETRTYACAGRAYRLASFRHEKSGAVLQLIPGGAYTMGSDKFSSEKPAHAVRLSGPFLIGRAELSQAAWDRVGGEDARRFRGEELPVDGVSWDDARAWLEKAGDGLRLPSEAEWEYAARAGSQTRYFWGEDVDSQYCWFKDNSGGRTRGVGEHAGKANAFGLVDTAGNVFEWCQDSYVEGYADGPIDEAAREPAGLSYRVTRGGSWLSNGLFLRSALRSSSRADARSSDYGLRLARSLDLSASPPPASPASPASPAGPQPEMRLAPSTLSEAEVVALLCDRERWARASREDQDAAIVYIRDEKLGAGFAFVGAAVYRCAGIEHRIASFRHKKSGARLNLIPGGRFMMGSGAVVEEQPVHGVTIRRPFLIGSAELSQAAWDRVGGEDARSSRGEGLPIGGVSWDDARAWLAKAGDGLRLPSEAEWEYAARAGSQTKYFWGEAMDETYCWYGPNSALSAHPSADHAAKTNAFGLVDSSGNLIEWVLDHNLGDYGSGPSTEVARESNPGTGNIVRGGGWRDGAELMRSSYRNAARSSEQNEAIGLRLARSLDVPIPGPPPDLAGLKLDGKLRPSKLSEKKIFRLLSSRQRWLAASRGQQDAAIVWVRDERLSPDYDFVGAARYRVGGQRHRIATFVHKETGALLNLIPGGPFLMGENQNDSEKPARKVTIRRPFLIGARELSQRIWDRVGGTDLRQHRGPEYPIDTISWDDARAWLKKAGGGLRLPSEAEWEYAARAGSQTTYYWGDAMDASHCWYRDNSGGVTHAVTEHGGKENAFGLFDMSGNLNEWCQDGYVSGYVGAPIDERPWEPPSAVDRVARGGSWANDPNDAQSATRQHFGPVDRSPLVGLRLARSIPLSEELAAEGSSRSLDASLNPSRISLSGIRRLLTDRLRWNAAGLADQDAAIAYIRDKKLRSAFKYLGSAVYESGGARHRIATFVHRRSGAQLNLIPGGTYTMGSSDFPEQGPRHSVTITRPFLIGRFELRRSIWFRVRGEGGKLEDPDLPIEKPSWVEVRAWLKKAGGGLRLPSEAEWEYAARAGTQTRYFWGDAFDASYCWYGGNTEGGARPVTAHAKKFNAFGLVDTAGNATEWCLDAWIPDYKSGPDDQRPRELPGAPDRVRRSFGWGTGEVEMQSGARIGSGPTDRAIPDAGFRVACSID